jgi:hypothetical protein
MRFRLFPLAVLVAGLAAATALSPLPALAAAQVTTVFSTDFSAALPPEFTAPGSAIESVQGYAGLGPPGYQFGGSFLRYNQMALHDTKLTLTGLPAHDHINVRMLLALIDSWDGTELMEIVIAGQLVFSNWFQLATGDTTSYVPPPGTLLSAGTNLGFTGGSYYQRDRAYNLAADPAFLNIPHTGPNLEVVWRLNAVPGGGAGYWQGGSDESWAIDQVAVDVISGSVGVEPGASGFGIGRAANPQRGASLRVECVLAGDAAASLDLFDVTGRRVATHALSGAGSHAVDLRASAPLAPGVYLVRLTQQTRVDTRRVALVR